MGSRIVGRGAHRDFVGDVAGGGRVRSQVLQRTLGLGHPGLGIGLAHQLLAARLVATRGEDEGGLWAPCALGWRANGPPGEHLGELGHVLLRVPPIHAHGVELEEFSSEVFVEALVLCPSHRTVGPHGLAVVEVDQHGGVAGRRQ